MGAPPLQDEEDDWFGEGNAFESGEDLASALLALVDPPAEEVPRPAAELEPAVITAAGVEGTFVLVDRDDMVSPAGPSPGTGGIAQAQRTWAVRAPGAIPLPPRAPGRSGWSIRNSVKVLQHTEEVMNSLREEAVVAALLAASRALRPENRLSKRNRQAR